MLESDLLPWVESVGDLGDDVLEVGPGPGLTTDLLRQRVARVTAVEVDELLAAALKERLAGTNVEVICADATATGLEPDRFSTVTSFSMLHHMPSAEHQDLLFACLLYTSLPANVVAAHVTRECDRPIAFGCAVAMSARFGFDLDLANLTDDEQTVCRRAVQLYRDIRPLVQQGDLWRLVPPGERAALAYVAPDGQRAVVFAFQLTTRSDDPGPLRVGGLHPDRTYEVASFDFAAGTQPHRTDAGRRSGKALMEDGLEWPLRDACTARIWVLQSDS